MRIRQPQQVHLDYVQRMLASLLWLRRRCARRRPRGAARPGRRRDHALHRHSSCAWRPRRSRSTPRSSPSTASHFHLPAAASRSCCGDAADWLAQADAGQRAPAACRPVRPRGRRAGARRRGLLRRVPRGARARRRDGGQLVRPRRQLRRQHRAHRRGLRRRPGLEPAAHARRQHRRRRRARRGGAAAATCSARAPPASSALRRAGPAGAKWLRMVRPYSVAPRAAARPAAPAHAASRCRGMTVA